MNHHPKFRKYRINSFTKWYFGKSFLAGLFVFFLAFNAKSQEDVIKVDTDLVGFEVTVTDCGPDIKLLTGLPD